MSLAAVANKAQHAGISVYQPAWLRDLNSRHIPVVVVGGHKSDPCSIGVVIPTIQHSGAGAIPHLCPRYRPVPFIPLQVCNVFR